MFSFSFNCLYCFSFFYCLYLSFRLFVYLLVLFSIDMYVYLLFIFLFIHLLFSICYGDHRFFSFFSSFINPCFFSFLFFFTFFFFFLDLFIYFRSCSELFTLIQRNTRGCRINRNKPEYLHNIREFPRSYASSSSKYTKKIINSILTEIYSERYIRRYIYIYTSLILWRYLVSFIPSLHTSIWMRVFVCARSVCISGCIARVGEVIRASRGVR